MVSEQTVANVMRRCNNFFERGSEVGTFYIVGGILSPAPASEWVYIKGSRKNDGLHNIAHAHTSLQDETFDGIVWYLYPPADFIALCDEIGSYSAQNAPTGVVSESFGNYSHTDAVGVTGGKLTWQEAFSVDLTPWRRMFTEVG